MKSFLLKLSAFAFIGGVAAATTATSVNAAELHVMSSGGFTAAYKILGPKFAAASGNTLDTALGPSMGKAPEAIPNRLARGEPADVVIMVGYALDDLIKQGKVRIIGASNYTAPRLAEALKTSSEHDLPRFEVLQPLYNLYARADYEAALEPLCREQQIGVVTYFALASGFLTGKYRKPEDAAKSARGGGVVAKYLNERGFRILAALDEVGRRYGASPARVALAWQIARPTITAPIASATSVEQVSELLAATKLKLDQAAIEQLNSASA